MDTILQTIKNEPEGLQEVNDRSIPVFPFYRFVKEYNFGDYIPKDQGGKFIQMQLLKGEEDATIVKEIRNGLLEKIYGNPIGWDTFEQKSIEKSVWLNRFYYLPSFARLYYLTKDRTYLDDMMRIISLWISENPYKPDQHAKGFNWRDMQVAWRSIHLSWCLFLGAEGLSPEEYQMIVTSLKDHSTVLLSGFGQQPLNEFNHQSHGALAMLYLGILFPGIPGSAELIEKGRVILNHHLEKAFYPDGGNKEQMFGYFPFEAHIFRDAYLLLKSNGFESLQNYITGLKNMMGFMASVAQPDGTMPQINDSFEMPVSPTIPLIEKITGKNSSGNHQSVFFKDTQIAVFRKENTKNKWYFLMNPASNIGGHDHAGRLAFNMWYAERPMIIDSGCCNYDDPALIQWYRTCRAHNTVIIDGKTDAETSGDKLWTNNRITRNKITDWNQDGDLQYCRMISPSSEETNSSVNWYRSVVLVRDDFAIIYDQFEGTGEHSFEILFHLPVCKITKNDESGSIRIDDQLEIIPCDISLIDKLELKDGQLSVKGINRPAQYASYNLHGFDTVHSSFILYPVNKSPENMKIQQVIRNKDISLILTDSKGSKETIEFKDKQVKTSGVKNTENKNHKI
ncbi:MAG TPA: alginate lyase family protein [Bacteroidales bacterium]|nr:alginate lyase family protein [Bacteroidales bacterium]HPT20745.1 alginate lyase family protein [Bacteroidales bacterium]